MTAKSKSLPGPEYTFSLRIDTSFYFGWSQLVSSPSYWFRIGAFILGNRMPTWHYAPQLDIGHRIDQGHSISARLLPLPKSNAPIEYNWNRSKMTSRLSKLVNSWKLVRCVVFIIQLSKLNARWRFQMTICWFAMKKGVVRKLQHGNSKRLAMARKGRGWGQKWMKNKSKSAPTTQG